MKRWQREPDQLCQSRQRSDEDARSREAAKGTLGYVIVRLKGPGYPPDALNNSPEFEQGLEYI
jgi:hypothetical protein